MPYKKYARKYWIGFAVAIFFLMFETAADLMMPTILANIIDKGIAYNDLDYVLQMGVFMLLITASGAVSSLIRNVISSRVSYKFGAELRSDLFAKIGSMSFENIDKFERASLITRMTNDVMIVQNFFHGLMRIFVKAPMLGIGALIMAVRLNPDLAVVLIVVVPIVAILVTFNMKIGFARYMKVQQSLDRINLIVREYLSGVRVVKAFNRYDYEVDKFNLANEEQRSSSVHAMRAMVVFNPAIMLTVNLGIVVIIWLGGLWVDTRQMPVGHIVAFINYMTQVLFSLMAISMVFNMFVRARASTARIGEVFSQINTMTWKVDEPVHLNIQGKIDFEKVSFSYTGAAYSSVLKNVSLTFTPGKTVGIIGSTGSGKSSLAGLIPRFYDAVSGSVKIDNKDVKDLNPARLREEIAIVPQKSVLFTGTIMENIRWGNEQASFEEIQQAAVTAEAHDFISALPEGYESRLGQKGVNLSGGQKQRISIARALVRKPKILILDDCTSAVDTAAESKIKQALKNYTHGLTCIIIAQRITSVIDADTIVVMDLGEVVGVGSHKSLMKECRIYQEIFESQVGKEMIDHG
ncbi:MAG TPA: ABC transporter ATP-binding protein [Bacilli bacterium]